MFGDVVEIISVNDQIFLPIHCGVYGLIDYLDVAERLRTVSPQEFVVISRDIHDFCAMLQKTDDFPYNQGEIVSPIKSSLQFPPVDEVSDEVKCVWLVFLEEFSQFPAF